MNFYVEIATYFILEKICKTAIFVSHLTPGIGASKVPGIFAGIAINCKVQRSAMLARKNFFKEYH